MLGYLSNWLKDIIVLLIIISVIEILLPRGNMKKYINFIIGLLIILIIVSPLVDFLRLDHRIEDFYIKDVLENIDYDAYIDSMNIIQNDQIESLYIEKIKNDMVDTIGEKLNYSIKDIKISLLDKDQDKWDIGLVTITLEDKKPVNSKEMNIEKIEKVDLGSDYEYKKEDEDYSDLINLIHNSFQISRDKIIVKPSK